MRYEAGTEERLKEIEREFSEILDEIINNKEIK